MDSNSTPFEQYSYKWPVEIRNDETGFHFLSDLYNSSNSIANSTIAFDFQDVESISLDLCAPIGAIIDDLRRRNNVVNVLHVSIPLKDKFSANSFLQSLFPYYQSPIAPSYIMYKRFTNNEDNTFFDYVYEKLLNYEGFPKMSEELKTEITSNIQEIYNNAHTHGDCPFVYSCGEYNKEKNILTFTIADIGKTIRHNVREYRSQKELTGKECIEWAVISGNTTRKKNIPGGLGLSLIRTFLNQNKGWLQIVSSNGYWNEDGSIRSKDCDFIFKGTIVTFGINLSDEKIYI